jgi:hypothetical protein
LIGQASTVSVAKTKALSERGDLQIGDVPLVLWLNIDPMTISQKVDSLEVIHEASRVDYRNARIETSDLVQSTLGNQFG